MFFKTGFLKYCAQPPSPTDLLSLVFSFSRGCMARAGLSLVLVSAKDSSTTGTCGVGSWYP